jgi:hypothetical protein
MSLILKWVRWPRPCARVALKAAPNDVSISMQMAAIVRRGGRISVYHIIAKRHGRRKVACRLPTNIYCQKDCDRMRLGQSGGAFASD